MPRNVVSILHRPRAVSQTLLRANKRYQSSSSSEAPPNRRNKDADAILRIADQHTLRDTKIQAAKFISSIRTLQSITSAIPTTLRHPNVGVPFTIDHLRERVEKTTPPLAQKTIDAVENVRAHLTDLELDRYDDKKDKNSALAEFEREIATWDEEKKMDTLKTWRLEEEARLVRLNDVSQRLVDFVEEVLRRGSMKVPKRPVLAGDEASSEEDWEETKSENERKPGVVNMKQSSPASSSKAQQSPGLVDLQKQLEANITGPKK